MTDSPAPQPAAPAPATSATDTGAARRSRGIPRPIVMLAFRAVIITCLVVIGVRASTAAGERSPIVAFLPALVALLPTLFTLERVPSLRALVGLAWVLVFDLVVMGLVVATLRETTDPELLGFLLLGCVVATSRDLLAGTLAGAMAGVGYAFLVVSHSQGETSPLDPLVVSRATLFLATGLFTGFLSREAEHERETRALQTAALRQELADLGEHLRNVLSCVASGVLVVEADGRVATYNRAAERILGVPAHKVLGRFMRDVDDLASLRPALEAPPAPRERARAERTSDRLGRQDGGPRPDIVLRRADGKDAQIGYQATPLENLAGRRLGTILVFQDVTLIRDYEARLLRQEQLAALGRLVSGIAHEFGNLLGGARGHVQLARAGTPQDAVESLPIVDETLGRVLVTVENLLRFARGTPLHPVPGIQLAQVAERALHLLHVELEKHEVRVERRFAPGLPGLVADSNQLEQVAVNLIINSIHAMHDRPDRRVRVTVEARALEGRDGQVLVVEDAGPGVPPELRGRIFEPFFTTKGPLGGSSIPGTGLGLSMAEGVVGDHHGTIRVDGSPELGGARFVVHLPSTPLDPSPELPAGVTRAPS